jgi:hypothetical protein
MNGVMKGDLIEKVESQRGRRSDILQELQIPRSTYYHWRKALLVAKEKRPEMAKMVPTVRSLPFFDPSRKIILSK